MFKLNSIYKAKCRNFSSGNIISHSVNKIITDTYRPKEKRYNLMHEYFETVKEQDVGVFNISALIKKYNCTKDTLWRLIIRYNQSIVHEDTLTNIYDEGNGLLQLNKLNESDEIYKFIMLSIVNDYFEPTCFGHNSLRNQYTFDIINETSEGIFKGDSAEATDIFISNTKFRNNDNIIEISKLMNKYDIKSYELLFMMYHNVLPFNMGMIAYNDAENKKMTINHCKNEIATGRGYYDYLNGKAIKTKFRKNDNEEQLINVKSYEDRSYRGAFYNSIFQLMHAKKNNLVLE